MITIDGDIIAVDAAATPPTLSLRLSRGSTWTLTVDDDASIIRNGHLTTFAAVQVGDYAKAGYSPQGSIHLVKSLDAHGPDASPDQAAVAAPIATDSPAPSTASPDGAQSSAVVTPPAGSSN